MYQLTDEQYKGISYFKDLDFVPPERLSKYRKNLIALGGTLLIIGFAGIQITEFSGGLIKGEIRNPELLSLFLGLIFLYNFWMFMVVLNRSLWQRSFKRGDLLNFTNSVAKYAVTRELQGQIKPYIAIKSLSCSVKNRANITVQCSLTFDRHLVDSVKSIVANIEGLKLVENGQFVGFNYEYTASEQDKNYYYRNQGLFSKIRLDEFMEYIFPQCLGTLVLIAIYLDIWKVISGNL